MGSPTTGSKAQTTMSLARGKHQQSLSAGASLQLENARSAEEELSSGAAMSHRAATEEQSVAVKRRTRSSQGLELGDGAEERKPLSSISVGGHRRGGSASGSPRAKGMCSSPGAGKSALAKMAATALHSPTKLERSLSLSRVAHRVVPGVDGSGPRSRTGALPEVKQQDSQRELESRLQTVAALRSENGFSTSEKKVKSNNEQTDAVSLSCSGSGVKAAGDGDDENSHPETAEVASHGLLRSTEDCGEYLCSSGAHLPVKDIHPVCFETTNKLRAEQVPVNTSHDHLPAIARSCSPSAAAASTQEEPHLSNCNGGPELAACEPQSEEDLSNGTHTENSHPNVLPTSNLSPAGLDLPYQDIKEVTPPRAVCNQESEVEKNAHSSDLTKAATLSSLACEKTSVLLPDESKQGAMGASQGKDVKGFHFSAERRKVNGSEARLRKSTSFELGEKKTKIRKRRRSVSASGIGAMLLKIVRTSEPEHIEARPIPRADQSGVSEANPLLTTADLPQNAQFEVKVEIFQTDVEAVYMDVEYEDCISELAAAADTDIVSVGDNKDASSSEEVKLQIVDETHSKTAREGGPALHDSQEENPIAGSLKNECDKRVISSGNCNPHSDSFEDRFLDARDKSLDRNSSFESIEASSPIGKPPKDFTPVKEDGFGGSQRRRQHRSRGRISHDLDLCTVASEENRRSLSLVDENLCMITSLERSRSFASMLQVSPRQSVDEPAQSAHLAPSSIAILTNPSFSSSHQDRLWEEQAEYSSGGRGTPGRDDDDGETHTHSPSLSGADDAVRSTAASLRDMSSLSCSGFASDSGRSIKLGQSGKKRGRPQRSPLRSLLDAEDDDEPPATPRPSSERHHFLKQILSRLRGKSRSPKSSPHKPSSPKSSSHKPSSQTTTSKRRNSIIWSSCMCFSDVN